VPTISTGGWHAMSKVWAIIIAAAVVVLGGAALLAVKPEMISVRAAPALADVGGTRAILDVAPSSVEETKSVLERRLDSMGWSSASVRRDGEARLIVEVPGLFDTGQVARIVGTRGALSFRFVDENASDAAPRLPQQDEAMPPLALDDKVWITGESIVDATPGRDEQSDEPVVNFRFDATGTEIFARATADNFGRLLAIVLDGKILCAPRILGRMMSGAGRIYGNFTTQQARELASLLRAGRLPDGSSVVSVAVVKARS
jgi:SecD/SecF fusion protein